MEAQNVNILKACASAVDFVYSPESFSVSEIFALTKNVCLKKSFVLRQDALPPYFAEYRMPKAVFILMLFQAFRSENINFL